ncbi:MAG: dienelactone hydrolase family protein, partial [Planctomycetaceae bacterium]
MRGMRLRRWSCLFLLTGCWVSLSGAIVLRAADERGLIDRVYTDEAGEHKYVVFVPKNYSLQKTWPTILYLHGAGERGVDGSKPLTVGLGPYIQQRIDSFPFLVVFPQCEDVKGQILTGWAADSPDGRRALAIFEKVEQTYHVDESHRILTGWSMGGYGAWSLAAASPAEWSAVVPMSGGGDVNTAAKLKDVPIWAFHGADDKVVPSSESRKMVEAVNAAGGHARYSEIANVGHHVWQYAYANEDVYRWMLDPAAHASAETRFRAKPGERPQLQASDNEPFVPAVEIPHAVYIRMGNDMLKTLADSVPRIVPRDVLVGGIGDIYESTVTDGYYFNVQFSQISYSGTVERAIVKAYRKDRLNVQLGLRNVVLRIGRTYLSGEGRSAVAGPINIVIGTSRPVWLSLALEPYVDKRKLRLRLVATRFEIPGDNWYVSGPAGVSTSGLGMTSERVSSGLVSGIYGKKARIEHEVNAVVPKLLARLEENLERKDLND